MITVVNTFSSESSDQFSVTNTLSPPESENSDQHLPTENSDTKAMISILGEAQTTLGIVLERIPNYDEDNRTDSKLLLG